MPVEYVPLLSEKTKQLVQEAMAKEAERHPYHFYGDLKEHESPAYEALLPKDRIQAILHKKHLEKIKETPILYREKDYVTEARQEAWETQQEQIVDNFFEYLNDFRNYPKGEVMSKFPPEVQKQLLVKYKPEILEMFKHIPEFPESWIQVPEIVKPLLPSSYKQAVIDRWQERLDKHTNSHWTSVENKKNIPTDILPHLKPSQNVLEAWKQQEEQEQQYAERRRTTEQNEKMMRNRIQSREREKMEATNQKRENEEREIWERI